MSDLYIYIVIMFIAYLLIATCILCIWLDKFLYSVDVAVDVDTRRLS